MRRCKKVEVVARRHGVNNKHLYNYIIYLYWKTTPKEDADVEGAKINEQKEELLRIQTLEQEWETYCK